MVGVSRQAMCDPNGALVLLATLAIVDTSVAVLCIETFYMLNPGS